MSNAAQWLIIIAVYGIVVVGFVLAFISDPRKRFIVACALFFGGVGTLLVAMAVSIRADNEAAWAREDKEAREQHARDAAMEAREYKERPRTEAEAQVEERWKYQRLHPTPTPYPYLQPAAAPRRLTPEQERAEILRKYGANH